MGTPITKASPKPIPSRANDIPNASQTVVRPRVLPSTSSHMKPSTLAGRGISRVGRSGTTNCQAAKKRTKERIRAKRGVATNVRTRARNVGGAGKAVEVTISSQATSAPSRHHRFLAPAEEALDPPLQQHLLEKEGEGKEEEDPRQHGSDIEQLKFAPHHEADP